jgi:arsenate reductase
LILFKRKLAREQDIRLNFICTHNSRKFIASLGTNGGSTLQCKKVFCYSGGVEATALFPGCKTLEQAGFEVRPLSEGKTRLQHKYSEMNIHYRVF